MRADLNKLLCEHERDRSWDCYHNYRHDKDFNFAADDDFEEGDELITSGGYRESMKKRYNHGGSTKSFGENLNPLYGWVRKQLGRKWDKAYSELCDVFDKRSVINQHILTHLSQYVYIKNVVVGEDNKLWFYSRYNDPTPLSQSYVEYYVDPRDGVLKYNHRHKSYRQAARQREVERAKEQLKVKRVIDELTELHNIKGVWFEVKYVEHERRRTRAYHSVDGKLMPQIATHVTEYPMTYDVLSRRYVYEKRVAVSKRTLSHKELKKHSLI